jgi:hypothetical protein
MDHPRNIAFGEDGTPGAETKFRRPVALTIRFANVKSARDGSDSWLKANVCSAWQTKADEGSSLFAYGTATFAEDTIADSPQAPPQKKGSASGPFLKVITNLNLIKIIRLLPELPKRMICRFFLF